MLGAVKDEGEGGKAPLFRVLARRWKSLAPVQRERISILSTPVDDRQSRRTRAWISKGQRAIYANQKIEPAISKRAWNPWLWVK